MVKKVAATAGIGISHDRSKILGGEVDEFKSAISHTKESTGAIINPATYVLDPNSVLGLFKGMSDKVYLSLSLYCTSFSTWFPAIGICYLLSEHYIRIKGTSFTNNSVMLILLFFPFSEMDNRTVKFFI